MKRIDTLSHTDVAFVQYLQQVLSEHGIESVAKNENIAVAGLSDRAAYDLSPELWVIDDERYDEAVQIIEDVRSTDG